MKIRGRLKRVSAAIALSTVLLCCAVFSFLFFNNDEKPAAAESTAEQTETTAGNLSRTGDSDAENHAEHIVTFYELDGTNNVDLWNQAIQTSIDGNGLLVTVRLTADWNATTLKAGVGTFYENSSSVGCLHVPGNANILLDLNGFNITRSLTAANPDGSIFFLRGELEIMGDGEISGGWENNDGGGAFIMYDNAKLTLSGGTVTNNRVTGNGGAIVLYGNSTLVIDGATIDGNTAGNYGGGIYADTGTTLTIKSGTVAENYAKAGGGVYVTGATVSMSGGYVMGNTAEGGSTADTGLLVTDNLCGGGFCFNGGTMVLDGGTISNNLVTSGRGGGLYFFGESVFTMNGGVISTNTASYNGQTAGGGVSIFHATMYMYGGTITNNAASGASGDAGGIGIRDSVYEMYGGTVSENKVMSDTGAWSGGIEAWRSTVTLYDGTIMNNFTAGNGGGITIYQTTTFYMYGGTITNNKSNNAGGGIMFDGGATAAYFYGGIITNNRAGTTGGGVYVGSIGSITFGGKTVTKNGKTYGGGIKIYDNIGNNMAQDFYMPSGKKILVDSSLVSNSNAATIGIYMAAAPTSSTGAAATFIDSYNATTAGGLVTTFFFANNAGCKVQGTTSGQIAYGAAAPSITWTLGVSINKGTSWNSAAMHVKEYEQAYTGNWFRVTASAGTVISETSGKFLTSGSVTYFKDVGTYTFRVNDVNYTNNVFTVIVVPRAVTISWSESEIYYTAGKAQYPPAVLGGIVTGDDCHLTVNSSGAGIDAGTYTVTASLTGTNVSNYVLPSDGSYIHTYSILPRKLSKPYINGGLIYDGSLQEIIVGFDPTGMIITYEDSPAVTNNVYAVSAGTYYATIQLLDAKNFHWEDNTTSIVYLTSIVNKVVLSVSGISLEAKEYDGTSKTTLDVSSLSVLGVVDKDYGADGEIDKDRIWIIPVDYDTGIPSESGEIDLGGSTAGKYSKKITLQMTGSMKDNYTLLSDVYECITYITRATIKVTGGIVVATDDEGLQGKVYDGNTTVDFDTTNAVIVYSANGNACAGVTVDAYGGYTSVNAGSSVLALIWSLKLGGTLAENYELDVASSLVLLNDGTITGEIVKKDVTAVITAGDCVYGSVPNVTYVVTGAVAGEAIKLDLSYLNGTDNTTVLKTAGVYTITAALTSAFDGNYNLTSVTPNGGADGDTVEVEITKAPLTITVYDAEVYFSEGTANNGAFVTGLVWSDTRASLSITDSDLTFTYGDFDTDSGAVATYVLSIDTTALSLANYTVTVVDGTLTVNLKSVSLSLTVTNGIYGGTGANAAAVSSVVSNNGTTVSATVKYTYNGTSYDGTVYTDSTTIPVKPGEYTVTAEVDTASGYTGRATALVKIARASLTVTVTPVTAGTTDKVEYGTALTSLTAHYKLSYSGWVNGDELDNLGNPTQTGDIVPANAKWSTDYFQYAPVGTYDVIVSGLTSDNYEITYVNGALTVEKANATVTINNQSSVYDGKVPVAGNATGINYTVTGLKRSADDLGVSIAIANAAKDAGVYDLEASASNGNYNVTFVGETASNTATDNSGVWTVSGAYTVNKAKLTVTADDKSVVYGDAAPAFTATYEGFIGAEGTSAGPAAGIFSTELVLGSAYVQLDAANGKAGAYDIVEDTAAVADNYDITFVKGTLTVTQKDITVTIDRTKTVSEYGKTPINFSVNTSDYYTFDTDDLAQSTDDLLITLSHGVTTSSNAGTYVITAVSGNANYNVTFIDCVYTVEQYKITVIWYYEDEDANEIVISAGDVPKFEYNGASQGPSAYFNMPGGKIPVPAADMSGWQTNAGTGYMATVIIPDTYKGNYTFDASTYNTQAFEITPRELTITWSAPQKDSDGVFYFEFNEGVEQHPTATFGNVVSGETVNPVYVGATGLVCTSHTVEVQITDKNYSLPSNTTIKYYIVQMSLNSFYWTHDGTTNINASTYTYTYDGETHMPTAMAGVSITFSYVLTYSDGTSCGNRAVNAGEYTVTAVPSDSNYKIPDGASNQFTFTIAPKEVKSTEVYYDTLTFVYTGYEQMPVFWYTDVNGARIYLDVTVSDEHKVADTYTAEISAPADKNYMFTGDAANYTKQYTIAPKDIEVEWTLNNGEWVTDFVDSYNGSVIEYSATANMISTYAGELNAIGLKFEITRKDSATSASTVWTGDICDAGIYTLRAYVSDKNLAANYNVKEFSRQITIDKLPLQITVNGGNDYTVSYNDVAPKYTADFDGLLSSEETSVKAAVEAVENWIFSQYIRGAQPGSYPVTLTTDSDKLKVLREILRNYDWEQSFTGVKVIVNSTTGTVLVLADNGTNEFVYDGTSKLPEAFYTPTTGNGQQRKLEVSLLALNPDGTPNGYLTDGEAINEGTYYISVNRVSGDTDLTELMTDGLYFRIIKRTVIVKIYDREADYGEVTQTNRNTHIVTEYLSTYGGRNGYLPLAADVAGLAINVDCRFLKTDGTSNYDSQGYAQVGVYLIEGTWNSDDYSDNYEVIFVGSASSENGQFSAGVFTINKADINVISQGDAYFEEYGDFDSSDPRYVIKLADKTDGEYNNIVYSGNKRAGNTDAAVTIKYVDKQLLSDAVEPKLDAEYNLTDAPRITAAGEWVIYYKIEVAGGNHNTYYGVWRVQIRPEQDFIIVIFEKEFAVPYGDGVPEDLTEQLFAGGYYRLGNNAVSKEWFRANATAYVASVTQTSEVGLYNIYFTINEDAVTGSLEYAIKYSDSNYTPETNIGKYRIEQRLLTVTWSEESEFVHDGEAHLPELSISGWIDGGTLTPDGVLANGERRYIYKDGNKEIVITVTADGDFTEIGGHALKVDVGNSNYRFEVTNAVKSVSITADTVIKYGYLPNWAWYVIGIGVAVLALAILILALKLKHRKAGVGGTSDEEGFYDEMLLDEVASDSEEQ